MARYADMFVPPSLEDDESDEEICPSGTAAHRAKPRRKSHQRPQGSDQVRQAFSKRKKGLVLKAYQLSALTDAKVFMFIVNDKGTSWAYATPGFPQSLNPELLKELRVLAQVPEQAKIITEVMPDPPIVKPDTTATLLEHPALRRADQVPSSYIGPCTRTATGSTRSRSSYSGGSAGEPPAVMGIAMPAARSGSTVTAARLHSAAQSVEHSPPDARERPMSGSSTVGACAYRSSVEGHNFLLPGQLMQQVNGKLLMPGSMEPSTPGNLYTVMGQHAPVPGACTESPVITTEVTTSCGSPSTKTVGGTGAAAAAAACTTAVLAGQASKWPEVRHFNGPVQQQWGQQQPAPSSGGQWMQVQQLPLQQLGFGSSGAEVQQEMALQTDACATATAADCQPLSRMCSSTGDQVLSAADGLGVVQSWQQDNQQQQQQQQMQGTCGPDDGKMGICSSPPNSSAFENLQRCLPPLRVGRTSGSLLAATCGPHSAPAGAVSTMLGAPSQWMDFGSAEQLCHLKVASDAGYRPSSSGYSSYGPSPTYAAAAGQMQPSCVTTFKHVEQQQQHDQLPGTTSTPTAAAFQMLPPDPSSADPSPTAALSYRMCTLLAMDSPVHPAQQQQQQQLCSSSEQVAASSWDGLPGGAVHVQNGDSKALQQQQQHCRASTPHFFEQQDDQLAYQQQDQEQLYQQHNQGMYMPRTDDIVSDPLMDFLMDEAAQQEQQRQQRCQGHGRTNNQHVSIMQATLQQPVPQHVVQQPQHHGSSVAPPLEAAAAATTQAFQQPRQLVHVASMLDHLPFPKKNATECERAAWAEQVRNMVASLPPQQHSQFMELLYEKSKDMTSTALESSSNTPCFGISGSNMCSPVLSTINSTAGNNTAAGGATNYLPRLGAGMQGGKQRHGPSRLSATSPATDAAVAGATVTPADGQQHLGTAFQMYMPEQPPSPAPASNPAAQSAGSAGQCPAPNGLYIPAVSSCQPVFVPAAMAMPVGSGPMSLFDAGRGQVLVQADFGPGMAYTCDHQMLQVPMQQQMQGPTALTTLAGPGAPSGYQQQLMQQQQQCSMSIPGVTMMMMMPAAQVAAGGAAWGADNLANRANPRLVPTPAAAQGPSFLASHSAPAACAGGLLGDTITARGTGGLSSCSSPLKRGQPCSSTMLSGLGSAEGAMSPLKRTCRELPEPPSFATLMQTEEVEEDAVAWAASAAATDSLKMLGSFASLDRDAGNLSNSGSLPAFVNVGGSELVAAQVTAAAAAAAATSASAAAGTAHQQEEGESQQQAVQGSPQLSGGGWLQQGSATDMTVAAAGLNSAVDVSMCEHVEGGAPNAAGEACAASVGGLDSDGGAYVIPANACSAGVRIGPDAIVYRPF